MEKLKVKVTFDPSSGKILTVCTGREYVIKIQRPPDFVELELVDEDGNEVPSASYILSHSASGEKFKGCLDKSGHARVFPLPPGTYAVAYPHLIVRDDQIDAEPLRPGMKKTSVAQDFIYMDAGAWQVNQDPHKVTTFGIIAGKDVVLCNWLPNIPECLKGSEYVSPKSEPPADIDQGISKLLSAFQAKGKGKFCAHERSKADLLSLGKVILVIPDLHLHLLKGSLLDNFAFEDRKTEFDNGEVQYESLEGELEQLLDVAMRTIGKDQLEVIQMGDLFELWESRAFLNDSIGMSADPQTPGSRYYHGELITVPDFRKARTELLRRNIITEDIAKRWPPDSLSEQGNMIAYAIRNKFQKIFRFDFRSVQGNHDSWLGEAPEVNRGRMLFEHGHASDPANTSSNGEVPAGYWVVDRVVVPSEFVGEGTTIKSFERIVADVDTRPLHLGAERALAQRLRVFVNAHTHRPKLKTITPKQMLEMLEPKHDLSKAKIKGRDGL